MPSLFAFLLAAALPLVKKVLIGLGIGVVSYAAVTPLIDTAVSHVLSNYGAIGDTTRQLLDLSGGTDAIGILASSMAISASFMAFNRFRGVTT